jgi:Amt family ammonium transporter
LFTNLFIVERRTGEAKFDLVCLMNGCLGGLVAITAGCSTLEPYGAVVVGVIAGWIYLATSHLLIKFRLDDAVDAIPVHMACGGT